MKEKERKGKERKRAGLAAPALPAGIARII